MPSGWHRLPALMAALMGAARPRQQGAYSCCAAWAGEKEPCLMAACWTPLTATASDTTCLRRLLPEKKNKRKTRRRHVKRLCRRTSAHGNAAGRGRPRQRAGAVHCQERGPPCAPHPTAPARPHRRRCPRGASVHAALHDALANIRLPGA